MKNVKQVYIIYCIFINCTILVVAMHYFIFLELSIFTYSQYCSAVMRTMCCNANLCLREQHCAKSDALMCYTALCYAVLYVALLDGSVGLGSLFK